MRLSICALVLAALPLGLTLTLVPAQARALTLEVQERVAALRPEVGPALEARFRRAGLSYPPQRAVLAVFKEERVLRLYAGYRRGEPTLVHQYYVQCASGDLGPKLRQGDEQVPEGIYSVISLNPRSRFHLSLELNYPNAFDRQMAARENRFGLGGDIFIHGGMESVGCVAVGDPAIEELFVLAADVGIKNLTVILSPTDLRTADPDLDSRRYPAWTRSLYAQIREELKQLDERREP